MNKHQHFQTKTGNAFYKPYFTFSNVLEQELALTFFIKFSVKSKNGPRPVQHQFYRGIVDQIYTTSQKSWATPRSLDFASNEPNFLAIFLKWSWVIVLQASWMFFKVFLWTLASWTCSEEYLIVTSDFGITKAYSSRPTNNLTKNRHFVTKGQLQKHTASSHFFSNEKCKR